MKLKPKGVKDPVKSRMKAIICFADVSSCIFSLLVHAGQNSFPQNHSVENGLAKAKENKLF